MLISALYFELSIFNVALLGLDSCHWITLVTFARWSAGMLRLFLPTIMDLFDS